MNQIKKLDDKPISKKFDSILPYLPKKARLNVKTICLLDLLSTQILRFLLLNYHDISNIAILLDPKYSYLDSSEDGTPKIIEPDTKLFHHLIQIFKDSLLLYKSDISIPLTVSDIVPGIWLDIQFPPYLLKGHSTFIITTIRKVNIVSYLLTLLNFFPFGFEYLQKNFLKIFCPSTLEIDEDTLYDNILCASDHSGKLLKTQAVLFLDLKTHAYISIITQEIAQKNSSITKDPISLVNLIPDDIKFKYLDIIFPENMANVLFTKQSTLTTSQFNDITSAEQDFIDRSSRRKENLLQVTDLNQLLMEYNWEQYMKGLLEYCNKHLGLLVWGRKGRLKSPLFHDTLDNKGSIQEREDTSKLNFPKISSKKSNIELSKNLKNEGNSKIIKKRPIKDQISELSIPETLLSDPELDNGKGFPDHSLKIASNKELIIKSITPDPIVVKEIQNMQNAMLNKPSKKPTSKRIWLKEEEAALVSGLKAVGPSWSKILDLYGPGGRYNEALKNRTQVQLKDKARNWKLYYLKNKIELPEYLLKVTGNISKANKIKKKKGI